VLSFRQFDDFLRVLLNSYRQRLHREVFLVSIPMRLEAIVDFEVVVDVADDWQEIPFLFHLAVLLVLRHSFEIEGVVKHFVSHCVVDQRLSLFEANVTAIRRTIFVVVISPLLDSFQNTSKINLCSLILKVASAVNTWGRGF